jgi:hypothetical protein
VRQGKFGPETDPSSRLQGLRIVLARLRTVFKEYRGIAQDPCDTRWDKVASAHVRDALELLTERTGRFSISEEDRHLQEHEKLFLAYVLVTREVCVGIQEGSGECSGVCHLTELGQTQGA